jgi:hypothetical protein
MTYIQYMALDTFGSGLDTLKSMMESVGARFTSELPKSLTGSQYKRIFIYMEALKSMMAAIESEMVARFIRELPESLTELQWKSLFIGTFVAVDALDAAVDAANLCNEEKVFFHDIIDYDDTPPDQFIENLQCKFNETPGLAKCQLENAIRQCLEASKKVKIIGAE